MILGFKTHFPKGEFKGLLPGNEGRVATNFIPQLSNGRKKTTLREGFRWKPNTVANCYTGVRTPISKFHFDKTVLSVQDTLIFFDKCSLERPMIFVESISVSGELLTISQNDGFYHVEDFLLWFWQSLDEGHGLFVGQMLGFGGLPKLNADNDQRIPANVINGVVGRFKKAYNSGKEGRERIKDPNHQLGWRMFLENEIRM